MPGFSSSACSVTQSERSSRPHRVRRRAPRCAAVPCDAPRSRAMLRIYVPFDTVNDASQNRRPPSSSPRPRNSAERMVTGRGFRSMILPLRAASYPFTPFTLIAEYDGGIWLCGPTMPARTRCDSAGSRRRSGTGAVRMTVPSASSVSVAWPNTTRAVYVFVSESRYASRRVAGPTQMVSTPDAAGSSVPVWPTRFSPKMRRQRFTTSCELMPTGLSMPTTSESPDCPLFTMTAGPH